MQEQGKLIHEEENLVMKGHIQTHAPEVLAAILDINTSDGKHFQTLDDQQIYTSLQHQQTQEPISFNEIKENEPFQCIDNTSIKIRENIPNNSHDIGASQRNFDRENAEEFGLEYTLPNGIRGLNFANGQEYEEDEGNFDLQDSLELNTGTLKNILENGGSEKILENTKPCCSTPVSEINLQRGAFYNEEGKELQAVKLQEGRRMQSVTTKENVFDCSKQEITIVNSQTGVLKKAEVQSVQSLKDLKTISDCIKKESASEKGSVMSSKAKPKKTHIIEQNISHPEDRRKIKSYRDIYSTKAKKTTKPDKNMDKNIEGSVASSESGISELNVPPEVSNTLQGFQEYDVQHFNNLEQAYMPVNIDSNGHVGNYGQYNFVSPYTQSIPVNMHYSARPTNHHGYPMPYRAVPGSGHDFQNPPIHESSYGSSNWYNSSVLHSDQSLLQSNTRSVSAALNNFNSPHAPPIYSPSYTAQMTQSAPPKTNYYSRPPLLEQLDFDNPNESGRLSSVLPVKEFLDDRAVSDRSIGRIHKRFVSDPQLSRTNPLPPIPGYSPGREGYSNPKKPITYKPYTLKEFKSLKPVKLAGGLGPNKKTDSYSHRVDNTSKQREYAELLRAQHAVQKQKWDKKTTKPTAKKEIIQQTKTKRQAALEYAKAVPKPQSGVRKQRPASVEKEHQEERKHFNEEKEVTLLEILRMRHEKEKNQIDAMRKDLKDKLR